MKQRIDSLENRIKKLCENNRFKHYKWYYKYHLQIVSHICDKLVDKYPNANKDVVRVLVWLHDLGKIISADDPDKATLTEGKKLLESLGFDKAFVIQVIEFCDLIDSSPNFERAPLEIQIVSSADGASHFIGPFYGLYWYENPDIAIEKIMLSNIAKAEKDLKKKIVLPEIKKWVKSRFDITTEQNSSNLSNFIKESL